MKRKVPIKCSAYLDNELIFENRFCILSRHMLSARTHLNQHSEAYIMAIRIFQKQGGTKLEK